MLFFTRRSRRSPAENRMMCAASFYHGARLALAAAVILLVCFVAGEYRARILVYQVEIAQPKNLEQSIKDVSPYRRWAIRILRDRVRDAEFDEHTKLALRLALVSLNGLQPEDLRGALLEGEPEDFLVFLQVLRSAATWAS